LTASDEDGKVRRRRMVFFFTPRGCEAAAGGAPQNEDYMIYMGLDKHENEVRVAICPL
jgi:hypothetical protein